MNRLSRDRLVSAATGLAARIYRGPVATLARRLHLNDFYWLTMTRVVGRSYTREIAGSNATLRTATPAETRQVVNLGNERAVVCDLLTELEDDDVFHDVGANVGIYSLLAADRIGGDRVVAFEPHPPTAARLRDNAQRSGVEPNVVEAALSTTAGEGRMTVPTDRAGVLFGRLSADGDVPVRLDRGDSLTDDVPTPTVLKIDVEGGEPDVLRGYGERLSDVRLGYVETHGNGEELESLLSGAGFSLEVVHERDGQEYIKAVQTE